MTCSGHSSNQTRSSTRLFRGPTSRAASYIMTLRRRKQIPGSSTTVWGVGIWITMAKFLGEASVDLAIFKFRGRKRISTLKAFLLQYHPDKKRIKAQLSECGRKFVSMLRNSSSSLPRHSILHEGWRAGQGFYRQPYYAGCCFSSGR